MIARRERSLVWGKAMTEDGYNMAFLEHGSFFDDHILIIRSAIFENQPSVLQFL